MALRVADLAARLNGELCGDGERLLTDVRGLEDAGPEHLSFLSNPRYISKLDDTRAGAILVAPGVEAEDKTLIRVDDPYEAFAQALAIFHPQTWPEPGVHDQASVHSSARVDGATIEAMATVAAGAVVEPGAWIQSGARVGPGARVGAGARMMPNSVLCEGCQIGQRTWLNPGAVVGSEGFGFAPTRQGNLKIPQVGSAVVGDDVEIGANSCVDRAAMATTVVHDGAKLDNLVQVGHAAEVGAHSMMVAFSGVAGSSKLGARTVLAAKAAVLGHIELGEGTQVGVASAVRDSQPAGARVTGVPAIDHRRWLRAATAFGDLPDMVKTIRRLEARVAELEARLSEDD